MRKEIRMLAQGWKKLVQSFSWRLKEAELDTEESAELRRVRDRAVEVGRRKAAPGSEADAHRRVADGLVRFHHPPRRCLSRQRPRVDLRNLVDDPVKQQDPAPD